MKIKILGSCGGENFPASFCCCEHCEMARRAGGKSLRSLSQTLIDGDLLIDFPSDTDDHCRRFGVNLGKIIGVSVGVGAAVGAAALGAHTVKKAKDDNIYED